MTRAFHPQKGPFLRALQPGEHFTGFYVLRNKQLEPFRDPSRGHYLTLILSDRSGQLMGRVWENAEETSEQLEIRTVIKVEGDVETYLDRIQANVLRVRPAQPEEYDRRDFLPTTEGDIEEMWNELRGYIERITDPYLKPLVEHFFQDADFIARFQQAPAAVKVHHAYLGGLLKHTLEVLSLCESVLRLYPQLNANLLYTGALLHDLGKVQEFTWEFDITYSDKGRLLGHIVMTDEMVTSALQNFPDFPSELSLRLRHILLSHHGRHEWGSPRRPMTLEAITLHHIENLDAQVNRFQLLLEKRPAGETWTEFDRLLKRYLYGGPEEDLSVEEQGWTE
ncbi:MAG: HD domain-containing protein [Chloroflexota bacterium]